MSFKLSLKISMTDGIRLTLLATSYLILVLHFCYGYTPVVPDDIKPMAFLLASILFFPVVFGLAAEATLNGGRRSNRRQAAQNDVALSIFAGFMLMTSIFFSFPTKLAAVMIGCCFLFGLMLWHLSGPLKFIQWALTAVIVLLLIKAMSPTYGEADMLPVIKWAGTEFLSGRNPYYEDYTSVTPGPFYYLPVQWLIYVPFVALGIDQNILNVLCLLGCVLLVEIMFRNSPYRVAILATFAGLCASRPAVEMIMQGQVWPIWLLLSAYAAAFSGGRSYLAAITLGVLLATNQTFILLLALAGVYDLRTQGFAKAFKYNSISILLYCGLTFPFARDPVDFIIQNYITLPRLAGIYSERLNNITLQMSLVNILGVMKITGLRGMLQACCGIMGLALIAFRRDNDRSGFLLLAGLTYIATISLNVQVWKYYYVPGLLLMIWSAAPIWRSNSDCASASQGKKASVIGV